MVAILKKETDEPATGAYYLRYSLDGRRRKMGLGSFNEISLAGVREAAREAVKLARKGIDPRGERDREREANLAAEQAAKPTTFRQLAEAVRDVYTPTFKGKYAANNWFNPIAKHVLPVIGDLPVDDISPRDIAAVLAAADAAGVSKTGKLLQRRVSMIFNAGIADGTRDVMRGNPADARLMRAIRPGKRATPDKHYRRIDLNDAPERFRALQEASEAADDSLLIAALDAWLVMIILQSAPAKRPCGSNGAKSISARSSLRFRWPRTKSGREHVVPLSDAAIEILERRLKARFDNHRYVFADPFTGLPPSHTYFANAPGRVGLDLGAPHSWRSIFSDWAGDIGEIAPHLIEFAIAHKLPKTMAAYRHNTAVELRRPVMEAYARWLQGDVGANVVAFPTRA